MKQHARKHSRGVPAAPNPAAPTSDTHLNPWITGAVLALFVARPLVAGDGAAQEGGGVMLVMLWVVLACIWLVSMAFRPRFAIRFGIVDACVIGLVLWSVMSAGLAMRTGSPRPAINMLWEWVAAGLSYLLLRQTAVTGPTRRLAMALMASTAFAFSAVGFYQTFVALPQARAVYERVKDDPQSSMQLLHQWYPAGSAGRQRFEDRLASSEPTATFSLTNSLAGFLTPWLVVVLGIAAQNWNVFGPTRRWCLAAMAVVIAGCLVWTKSRTSYVAAALGMLLLLPAWKWRRDPVSSPQDISAQPHASQGAARVALAIAAIGIMLFAIAAATGGVDREVLSEAGKSLGYRAQYWKATLPIVSSAPLFGCGPGQFQSAYTQFKLPEASEEVRDPHNLLLEVAATAGVPAAIFLIAALAAVAWKILGRPQEVDSARRRIAVEPPLSKTLMWGTAIGGVAIGMIASFTSGLPLELESFAIVLACVLLGLAVLTPWIERGTISVETIGAAIVAVVVNLLAAGGIAYPGVAGSLWLLVAVALNEVEDAQPARAAWSRRWAQLAILPACLVALACYFTAYRPVLESRTQLSRFYAGSGVETPDNQLLVAEGAVRADPLSIEAARLLAHEYFEHWRTSRDADMLDNFRQGARYLGQIAPNSSVNWAQAGRWYANVYRLSPQQERLFAPLAEEAFRRAVELFPNSAALHAELARVLETRGEVPAAQREASEALRLDQIMSEAGHTDKLLSDELRNAAQRIASSTANSGAEGADSDKPSIEDPK